MSILDISSDAYHADQFTEQPTLSASIAKILLSASPAHARAAHPRLNPEYEQRQDEKFDIGTAVHALLLEGVGNVHIVHADSWRTAAAKEERDLARQAGRVPLLATQWQDVQRMCDAVQQQLGRLDMDPLPLTNGKPEQTITWQENGVWCRARLDWLHDDMLTLDDVKSTGLSADPEVWSSRVMFRGGFDVQAVMYRRAVRALTGRLPEFRFVVMETSDPFAVSVVSLAPDALALADAKLDKALSIWDRCLEAGDWPGYPRRVCYAQAPGWAEAAWLEREAQMEEAA